MCCAIPLYRTHVNERLRCCLVSFGRPFGNIFSHDCKTAKKAFADLSPRKVDFSPDAKECECMQSNAVA